MFLWKMASEGSVKKFTAKMLKVLILVLVEDGFRVKYSEEYDHLYAVLILVLVEDGFRVMAVGPQVQG